MIITLENTNNLKAPLGGSKKSNEIADQNESTVIEKPKKPEEKAFQDFINQDLIPSIKTSLHKFEIQPKNLVLKHDIRPVIGGKCWMIYGELSEYRKFWLCFSSEEITSQKHFAISEGTSEPSLLESFLIDEKKMTLALLRSRLLQRLNGQKWLGKN